MCSVHIGIGHDHNLIVTEFGNIEIVSISFGKAASKSVDLDLRIGQYLVDGGLLYIEDLTADRQDSLIVTGSGSLGRTAGGISLYNKDLAERRIFLLTVGQLAVGIKRVFLLGEKIGLGTFFRLTDLGRFFRTGKYCLQCFQVSVASWLSSLVLVWPSKRGAGCLMETTAVIPFRISAPVKLGSLSFSTPISRA